MSLGTRLGVVEQSTLLKTVQVLEVCGGAKYLANNSTGLGGMVEQSTFAKNGIGLGGVVEPSTLLRTG